MNRWPNKCVWDSSCKLYSDKANVKLSNAGSRILRTLGIVEHFSLCNFIHRIQHVYLLFVDGSVECHYIRNVGCSVDADW